MGELKLKSDLVLVKDKRRGMACPNVTEPCVSPSKLIKLPKGFYEETPNGLRLKFSIV